MPEPDMRTLGLDMLEMCDGSEGTVDEQSVLLLRAAWRRANDTLLYIPTCDVVCVHTYNANAEMRECESHHTSHSRSFVATIACFDQASLLVRPREAVHRFVPHSVLKATTRRDMVIKITSDSQSYPPLKLHQQSTCFSSGSAFQRLHQPKP